MESTANQYWFLSKHEDGSVFGPLPFEQVRRWAAAAQVAPHDKLSHDQLTWLKAPMFPELEMDWLVEVTSERYYGPTSDLEQSLFEERRALEESEARYRELEARYKALL